MKQDNTTNQLKSKNNDSLGLDMDEQEMNGLYGMVETPEEDALHSSNLKE
ncbi:DUF4021 domain-containing protein [Bacillus sp. B1-b2]|nr:DUF4021 domain-containing protein [Bacillus sp. B1-b2]